MITAKEIEEIGTGTNDPLKNAETRLAQLLAINKVAEVLKKIGLVLVEIRDQHRADDRLHLR